MSLKIEKQQPGEFLNLVRMAGEFDCRSYLEIGSLKGESLLAMGSIMERVVSIDLPSRGKSGRENHRKLHAVGERLNRSGTHANLISGSSRDPKVIAAANGKYDLVFIDGDHSYAGVEADFVNFLPMASKLIAFHDVCHTDAGVHQKYGVRKLWNEIKNSGYNTRVFYDNWLDACMGIGVVILEDRTHD